MSQEQFYQTVQLQEEYEMNTQPEALRLANALEMFCGGEPIVDQAYAELHRLHAENERKDTIIKSWIRANAVGGWIDDLRALNAELLEALIHAVEIAESKRPGTWDDLLQYRAAIAKAEAQQ